jgi:hypothetical protein
MMGGENMPISVRLDEETEALLLKTAAALNTTKTVILKSSIRDFCKRTLEEKAKKPYALIADLVGKEFSGQGNLAIDSEKILRRAFRRKS